VAVNPELLRNVWLEMTPVKRWGVPFSVALVIVMVLLMPMGYGQRVYAEPFMYAGLGIYGLFSVWAATKGLTSITQEISAGTWDMQRLAGHRPWDLLVGKLVGSGVSEWYGAVMGLALFTLARMSLVPPWIVALEWLTLVGGTLLIQCFSVFASLAAANTVRSTRRPARGLSNQGAGLILAMLLGSTFAPLAGIFFKDGNEALGMVNWWFTMPIKVFVPLSIVMFFGWTLAGAYRLLRAELQEPVGPEPWLGFLAFLTLYAYPFVPSLLLATGGGPVAALVVTATAVFGAFVPPLLLGERKDVVKVRSLAAAWRRGDRQTVWTQVPLWTFTVAGYAVCVLALLALAFVQNTPGGWAVFGFALGVGLLFIRDIGLVLAATLTPRPSRDPGMVVLFYFAVLYGLLPILAGAAGGDSVQWPMYIFFPFVATISHAGTAAVSLFALLLAVPLSGVTWALAVPRIRRALHPGDD
jgi:hypothetical protein